MLNDLLATIERKMERLCDESLIGLEGTPFDIKAAFDLYLKVSEINEEIRRSLKHSVLPLKVKKFIQDLLEVLEQVSSSLEVLLKRSEPLSSRILHTINTCRYALSRERRLSNDGASSNAAEDPSATKDFSVANKESAGLIMRLRVEIMESLQELDQLVGLLQQNPEDEQSLRKVAQLIKFLKGDMNSLKLILEGKNVLEAELEQLKGLFHYLYETLKRLQDGSMRVPERTIQVIDSSLQLLRRTIGLPRAKQEVNQSINDLLNEIRVEVTEEASRQGYESVNLDLSDEVDSNEGFALLIDLVGELMMSRNVFKSLSRQALWQYNLSTFSQELKATGNRFVRIMENIEDTVLELSRRYTKLVVHKRRVLPFESGGQALFLEVNQVIEVLKVPKQAVFKRWNRWFCLSRGETIGLVCLAEVLGHSAIQKTDSIIIIVITDGKAKLGVRVERIFSEQDVQVKSLPEVLVSRREFAGAAIMEDGGISLMIDGVALIQRVSAEQNEQED